MAAGTTKIVLNLVAAGQAQAIVSLGGTQGTTLSTAVMRALPYGFPKIMVSTMASGNVALWVDTKDITMMFSVTDIMGLNPLTCRIWPMRPPPLAAWPRSISDAPTAIDRSWR